MTGSHPTCAFDMLKALARKCVHFAAFPARISLSTFLVRPRRWKLNASNDFWKTEGANAPRACRSAHARGSAAARGRHAAPPCWRRAVLSSAASSVDARDDNVSGAVSGNRAAAAAHAAALAAAAAGAAAAASTGYREPDVNVRAVRALRRALPKYAGDLFGTRDDVNAPDAITFLSRIGRGRHAPPQLDHLPEQARRAAGCGGRQHASQHCPHGGPRRRSSCCAAAAAATGEGAMPVGPDGRRASRQANLLKYGVPVADGPAALLAQPQPRRMSVFLRPSTTRAPPRQAADAARGGQP